MPTNTPERGHRPLTEAEFRTDAAAVDELDTFLSSETGVKLLRVLAGVNPMAALSTPEHFNAKTVRGVVDAQSGNGEALLSLCQGYNMVTGLLTHRLPTLLAVRPPKSRKGGAATLHNTQLPN